MTGGNIELAARGVQDIYLTSNPQMTFFISVYKRHTNFSIESIEQPFIGDFDYGKQIYCIPNRVGDLLKDVKLKIVLPKLKRNTIDKNFKISWINSLGNAIINYIDIDIGGQLIDRQYGQWMEIWSELFLNNEKKKAYNKMINKDHKYNTVFEENGEDEIILYIPLFFWFHKNPGLAIPLIALQHHEVRFILNLRKFDELFISSNGNFYTDLNKDDFKIISGTLICDYIFLDTKERKLFAKSEHQYLIEQVQLNVLSLDTNLSSNIIDLDFNHPVKELIWVTQFSKFLRAMPNGGKELFNFTNNSYLSNNKTKPIYKTLKIQFEGNDRIKNMDPKYFNLVQLYDYHTNIPLDKYINVFSFAFNPESHHPSGTCNFSKIDNPTLNIVLEDNLDDLFLYIYAINYNILKIKKGMAGLVYLN